MKKEKKIIGLAFRLTLQSIAGSVVSILTFRDIFCVGRVNQASFSFYKGANRQDKHTNKQTSNRRIHGRTNEFSGAFVRPDLRQMSFFCFFFWTVWPVHPNHGVSGSSFGSLGVKRTFSMSSLVAFGVASLSMSHVCGCVYQSLSRIFL